MEKIERDAAKKFFQTPMLKRKTWLQTITLNWDTENEVSEDVFVEKVQCLQFKESVTTDTQKSAQEEMYQKALLYQKVRILGATV